MKKIILALSAIVLGQTNTWDDSGPGQIIEVGKINSLTQSQGLDGIYQNSYGPNVHLHVHGQGPHAGHVHQHRAPVWWPRGKYFVDKFRGKKLRRPWDIQFSSDKRVVLPGCNNVAAGFNWDADSNTWGCNQFDWATGKCNSQGWLIGQTLRRAKRLTRRNTRNYLFLQDETGNPWMRLKRRRHRRRLNNRIPQIVRDVITGDSNDN